MWIEILLLFPKQYIFNSVTFYLFKPFRQQTLPQSTFTADRSESKFLDYNRKALLHLVLSVCWVIGSWLDSVRHIPVYTRVHHASLKCPAVLLCDFFFFIIYCLRHFFCYVLVWDERINVYTTKDMVICGQTCPRLPREVVWVNASWTW